MPDPIKIPIRPRAVGRQLLAPVALRELWKSLLAAAKDAARSSPTSCAGGGCSHRRGPGLPAYQSHVACSAHLTHGLWWSVSLSRPQFLHLQNGAITLT